MRLRKTCSMVKRFTKSAVLSLFNFESKYLFLFFATWTSMSPQLTNLHKIFKNYDLALLHMYHSTSDYIANHQFKGSIFDLLQIPHREQIDSQK